MARRRMTLRRIDPWSVLKFGAVVNACLLVIALLGSGILWFAIRQLGVIDQACNLATDVGFESCAVNGGNLFRYVLLLGLLWIVIQTGLLVFFAFLHNLIADLVGGVEITLSEGGGATMTSRSVPSERTGARQRDTLGSPPPRDEEQRMERAATSRGTASTASSSAGASSTSGADSGSGSGGQREDASERAPSAPPTAAPRRSEQRSATGGGWPWDPPQPAGGSSGSGQDRPHQERSSPERTEEQRTEEQRTERPRPSDDDNLFGRRDR